MGKLTVERAIVEKAMARISGGKAGRGSFLPILDCFLLETEDGTATVTMTNLSVAVSTSFPIDGTDEIRTAIPYGRFQKLISARKSAGIPDIRLKNTEKDVVLSQGKWRAKLKVLDPDEFPVTLEKHGDNKITIDGAVLYVALRSVIDNASKEDIRPIINGVHFLVDDTNLTMQATDGYRLGKVTIVLPEPTSFEKVLPRDMLVAAMPLIKTSETIEISLVNNTILMTGDDWRLSGQCVSGTYPDTAPIVDAPAERIIEIESAPLLIALSAAVVYEPISVILDYKSDGTLTLKATNSEYGDMNEGIEVNAGETDIAVGLNPFYLQGVLKHRDTLLLKTSDPNSPVKFEAKDGESLWIVMPMQVGGS